MDEEEIAAALDAVPFELEEGGAELVATVDVDVVAAELEAGVSELERAAEDEVESVPADEERGALVAVPDVEPTTHVPEEEVVSGGVVSSSSSTFPHCEHPVVTHRSTTTGNCKPRMNLVSGDANMDRLAGVGWETGGLSRCGADRLDPHPNPVHGNSARA